MKSSKIKLSEIFTSIQGEMAGLGRVCLFIRTYGCNLAEKCSLDCDSRYSWDPKDKKSKILDITFEDLFAIIRKENTKYIVITGGEPMLQEVYVEKIIDEFSATKIFYIETNGTIAPNNQLKHKMNVNFNVSPKTPIWELDETFFKSFPKERTIFKFVLNPGHTKIKKFLDAYDKLEEFQDQIFVMPSSKNRKQYIKNSLSIVKICKKWKLNFCPREHLVLWDGKKGK